MNSFGGGSFIAPDDGADGVGWGMEFSDFVLSGFADLIIDANDAVHVVGHDDEFAQRGIIPDFGCFGPFLFGYFAQWIQE